MLIQVKVVNPHLRKHPITGSGGRMYSCDADGWLRAVRDGRFLAPDPGVHPDCAARFKQISDYKVQPPPKEPQVAGRVAPPPPPAGRSSESEAPDSDADNPMGLPDDDVWTIPEWLKNAHEMGTPLTDDDKRLRPKAKLVKRIRERAAEAAREADRLQPL